MAEEKKQRRKVSEIKKDVAKSCNNKGNKVENEKNRKEI